MTPTIIDQSLYCQFEDDQIFGINGSYVDDLFVKEQIDGKPTQMLPSNDSGR